MIEDAVTSLRRLVAEVPSVAGVFGAILDSRESKGRLPGKITVTADGRGAAALATALSARAIKDAGPGRVRLDLSLADRTCRDKLGIALDAVLYAVLERAPRDPAALRAGIDAALETGLGAIAGSTDASRSFVAAELAHDSESRRIAHAAGAERAVAEVDILVRAIDAALALSEPIRIANFSARVLGDSKALAANSERARRLGRALLDHHEPTAEIAYVNAVSERQAVRLALELSGICRDEATLTAYCFGPLIYRKGDRTFDHVWRHAELGEPVALSLSQLRGAAVAELAADRVLVIENQTPFLDYIDHIRTGAARELVVLSRGQANWAVVELLRMASRAGAAIAHTGDLDRSGVLILRSLEHRLFRRVEPVAMDVATHRRFRDRGRELTCAELERLRVLCERDAVDSSCRDLLVEIARTGIWIEQEHIVGEMFSRASGHVPLL